MGAPEQAAIAVASDEANLDLGHNPARQSPGMGQDQRTHRRLQALAWAAAASTIALTGLSIYIRTRLAVDEVGDLLPFGASAMLLLAIGVLISVRRPGNLVGSLMVGQALLLALLDFTGYYGQYGLIDHPGSIPGASLAALWSSIAWPTLYVGLVAVMLVFPDGKLPTPRWRRVAIGAAISFVGLIVALSIAPGALEDPFKNVQRPLPTLPEGFEPIILPFWLGTLASLFAAATAIRVRLRRATEGERLQLLWVAYGALFLPAALLVCLADYAITGNVTVLTALAVLVMELAIASSIAVAILRYRLFDIELILSRSLLYGGLSACIVAIYLAVVGGLSVVVPARGALGLVATGIVAVGIQPLRLRLQGRVDRLIYGDRDDPYAALTRLGDRLQATLEPEAVTASIVQAVAEALRVSFVAIEFQRGDRLEVVASKGGTRRAEAQTSTPLAYQGQPIGRLVVEPPPGRELSAADRRLLADLARHAGAALHGVRLTADLQHSRERLVSTREEERRRLRRDLHDSLGPTLAGMAFTLDAARNLIETDPDRADRAIGELRRETQEAIEDIRRVAHDLRPPALDELGFVPALRAYAERLDASADGLSVGVRAAEPFPELAAATEVAGYRIVLEALTNVSRHASAGQCIVALEMSGSVLRITVSDDGVGIDPGRAAGVGMGSMRERAEELGGDLSVAPRVGGGTAVVATLPTAARE